MVENFPKSAIKHSKKNLIFLNFMNLSTILCPCQMSYIYIYSGKYFRAVALTQQAWFLTKESNKLKSFDMPLNFLIIFAFRVL